MQPGESLMKLIVGLGNPGIQYEGTRHNIGRVLVESIGKDLHVAFSKKRRLNAEVAESSWDQTPFLLAFPEVFMNVSGQAIQLLAAHYGIQPETDLLIVIDEFALPFGRLRLRPRGQDAGHNGLKSIDQVLGHQNYARLRLGIGLPADGEIRQEVPLEEYVLNSFEEKERKALPAMLQKGREACRLWLTRPIEEAMNTVNAL